MRTADHPAFLPNTMSPENGGRLYLMFFSPAPQAMLSREEVLSMRNSLKNVSSSSATLSLFLMFPDPSVLVPNEEL